MGYQTVAHEVRGIVVNALAPLRINGFLNTSPVIDRGVFFLDVIV